MEKMVDSTYWSGKRVFVTGATGLVGSWLCQRLVGYGATVIALVKDQDPQSLFFSSGTYKHTHIVNGRLEDYPCLARAIAEHSVDTIIHLGAQALVGVAQLAPLDTFESNIKGTYNLLDAARNVGGKTLKSVVIASSDKAYGDSKQLPYTEDMPLMGQHPYDVSKSCTDLLSLCYAHTYALPVAIARCGNIFGGGDMNWSRIVPGTIRSLLANEAPLIRSDGTLIRDYIYIEDIVDAYLCMAKALAEKPQTITGEAFNFSLDSKVNVLEMVTKITELMGKTSIKPTVLGEAKAEILHQYLLSDKAKKMLGWQPRHSLDDGLKATIDWYTDFLSAA